jgi:hypothetical protein
MDPEVNEVGVRAGAVTGEEVYGGGGEFVPSFSISAFASVFFFSTVAVFSA